MTAVMQLADKTNSEAIEALAAVTPTQTRPDLWEVCCSPESRLARSVIDAGGKAVRINLEQGYDLRKQTAWNDLKTKALRERPRKIWFSLPCTAWSMMQNANQRTPEQAQKLRVKRWKAGL